MPLPTPIGRQKEVLYLPPQGHIVVLGTAGSGKSTMAVWRAAHLANNCTDPAKRVLLVTFNRMLVRYLASGGQGLLPPSVDVRTYHAFALGYLRHATNKNHRVISKDYRAVYIQTAITHLRQQFGNQPILQRPIEMISTEFEWLAKVGIDSVQEYIKSERVGRTGTIVARKDRPLLFRAYEKYLELRQNAGYDCDWDDMATSVLREVERDNSNSYYQHIILDEGQDFSPVMLRSLSQAIPGNGSLMFFGDVAQQIYGTRISWRSAGLNSPQIWYFKENYRNSKQIARLGLAISQLPHFRGEADLVEPREPQADGPLPALVQCRDIDQEIEFAVLRAATMGRTQTVAILMRNRDYEERIDQRLKSKGIAPTRLHRDLSSWSSAPGVYYGTYHSAKGLEFDAVIMPLCSSDIIPSQERIIELGDQEDALAEEGRLIYVAVTRAKKTLIMTFAGTLTPLLPLDESLYQKVNL